MSKSTSNSSNMSITEQRKLNLMKWVGFWRNNPHKFVESYLGVQLFLYQKILIYMMNKYDWFMYIAARGQGKSFIIAVYCVVRCILYPDTRIVIASGTKKQAGLIITEKITRLYNDSYAIRKEIEEISDSLNAPEVIFKNGSKISAETSNDNSRGLRGNIIIIDEFRILDKDTIDNVFKPMLNVNRIPPYMAKPEYKNMKKEENKEIYISSAWYQTHWMWSEFKSFLDDMLDKENTFVAAIPYQLSVFHGLLSMERINRERTSKTFNQTNFNMEYEALFIGDNGKSYFKLADINACRTNTKTFIPPTNEEFVENAHKSNPKKLSNVPRVNKTSEIRFIALDIALLSGSSKHKNDSSAFVCFRFIQDGNRYRREVSYIETINRTIADDDLAVRLKQLYYDFEADYVGIDTNGVGLGVYLACTRILRDEERDIEYEAWSCINDDEMNKSRKVQGTPIIYSIKGTAQFNHEAAVSLKSALENRRISLPMNDISKREELVVKKGFLKKSTMEQNRELYSFQQASALASELVALETEILSGKIKVKEVGTNTKDRYSALSYGNWYADYFEEKLNEDDNGDFENYLFT